MLEYQRLPLVLEVMSQFVIFFLKEYFEGILLSKIIFPFPWNPQLKTDVTSLFILFFIKDFIEKEISFLFERFH